MEIIAYLFYVPAVFSMAYAINIVISEKKKSYIILSVLSFLISIVSMYVYDNEYFAESLLSTLLLSLPVALSSNLLPKIIIQNNRLLVIIVLIESILLILTLLVTGIKI